MKRLIISLFAISAISLFADVNEASITVKASAIMPDSAQLIITESATGDSAPTDAVIIEHAKDGNGINRLNTENHTVTKEFFVRREGGDENVLVAGLTNISVTVDDKTSSPIDLFHESGNSEKLTGTLSVDGTASKYNSDDTVYSFTVTSTLDSNNDFKNARPGAYTSNGSTLKVTIN